MDGGGVRGLLTAVILEELCRRVPGWLRKVDLVAGTSTGGIIALGLAKGLDPADLRALYHGAFPRIFRDSLADDIRDLGRLIGAEYDTKGLERELRRTFGATRLQDLKVRVLITAFDLDNEAERPEERCWKPKFFHNFPGPDSDGALRAAEVALFTSAAPTYFPSVAGYIDGGVVANNPAMAALAQTQDSRARIRPRPELDQISLLSIGTGRVLSRIAGRRKDWGVAQWAGPLVRLMFDGLDGVPDYQCRQLLGRRYLRLNHIFPPGREVDLDDWRARDRLVEIGETGMDSELEKASAWLRRYW